MSDLLGDKEINAALKKLPEWELEKGKLTRVVEFEDFMEAIDFVNLLAEVAEEEGHHPDIDIRYSRVTVALITHDAGGITEADLNMAQRVENLVE